MAKAKVKSAKSKTKPASIVTFLLDRSGSMNAWKPATMEGFNGYLASLKEETEADIAFTFFQFDSVSTEQLYDAVPIRDVAPLSDATYQPRASTPLIDAAVKTIRAVEESLTKRKDKPKVVVCFQTDGEENASWAHNWEDLHGLVTAKTAEGWEFNFMGAGLDAYVQARKMGVTGQSTMSYQTDRGGTMAAFAASAGNTRLFSSGARANTQYTNSQKVASGDRYAGRHGVDDTVPGMSPPKKPPVGRSNRKP